MAGIQTRPEQLPPELAALLGADFQPSQRNDVLFVPSRLAPQSLAGLAFKLSLLLSLPAALFFAAMLAQALGRVQAGERFGSEGVGIAALIASLPAALSLLSGWQWRRATQLQRRIARGEFRLGLWITDTHVMQRDLNGGLECAPLQAIERLDIYHSGRPPLAMVLVRLQGGQTLRIVANWLQGEASRVEALQQLLLERWKRSQEQSVPRAAKHRPWTLTCADLFDREAEPTGQGTGADLLEGLILLWNLHLREGLQDDGQRTFCRFDLRWGEPAASTDVDDYLPHHAAGAPKLRRWLLSGDAQPLLASLARAHLRLLERGDQQAADRILEVAAEAQDREALELGLTRLA